MHVDSGAFVGLHGFVVLPNIYICILYNIIYIYISIQEVLSCARAREICWNYAERCAHQ